MRIAYLPKIYASLASEVTSLSGFNVLFWMLRWLTENRGVVVTIFLPEGIGYEGVETERIHVQVIDKGRKNWTFGASMQFEELLRKRLIDADLVLTNHLVLTGYYDLMQFEPQWGMNLPQNTPFLTYIDETEVNETMQFWKCENSHLLCACGGVGKHNRLMYLSDYERECWLAQAKRYFAPSIVQSMAQGRVVCPPIDKSGFDFELQKVMRAHRRAKDKTLVLFYAQSPQPGPWYSIPFEALESPLVRRDKVRWRLLSTGEGIKTVLPEREWIEYQYPCKRIDVLSALNTGDVVPYMGAGKHVGTALGVWEGVLGGQLPIFDSRTPALLGRIPEDYPFKVANVKELTYLLLYLVQHYDEPKVQEPLAALREFVSRKTDLEVQSLALLGAMQNLTVGGFDAKRFSKGVFAELVDQCKKKGIEGTSETMSETMSSFSMKGLDALKLLGTPSFRRLMQVNGYKDDCERSISYWREGVAPWQ